MTGKRQRVTRYIARVRLSSAGRLDTLPGENHDITGLSEADLCKLIDLGALVALPDSLPAPVQDAPDEIAEQPYHTHIDTNGEETP